MTYGCLQPSYWIGDLVAVSHGRAGEGRLALAEWNTPSSALRAPSPQGEKGLLPHRRRRTTRLHHAASPLVGLRQFQGLRGDEDPHPFLVSRRLLTAPRRVFGLGIHLRSQAPGHFSPGC